MELDRWMLFVGLGGSGLKVGAELHRWLKEELCGPDGQKLQKLIPSLRPYQLPNALQFVFADLDQRDIERYSRTIPAHNRTVIDLLSRFNSYSETAMSLRIAADRYIEDWLPSPSGEPSVSQLKYGASGFPTVARAALFSMIRERTAASGRPMVFIEPFRAPLKRLVGSWGELSLLKNGPVDHECDVFVCFSVAGGTGCGLFYDFFHFISEAFDSYVPDLPFQIHPLVVMPSVFRDEVDPRAARLNAGSALLDLFRLIDHQNAHFMADEYRFRIVYPNCRKPLYVKPSTIHAAHLFEPPKGIESEDLYQSIVAWILSMISTQFSASGDEEDDFARPLSFSREFLHGSSMRSLRARSGIGRRGVSTGLAAMLTLPQEQIAEIFADRLLGMAVNQLANPLPAERNGELRKLFADFVGLGNLVERPDLDPGGIVSRFDTRRRGAMDLHAELAKRIERMAQHLSQLSPLLDEQAERMAQFDYREGLDALLQQGHDPLRVERVIRGHPDLTAETDRIGLIGCLKDQAIRPPLPVGVREAQPDVPVLWNKAGVVPLTVRSRIILAALTRQDQWYRWRVCEEWSAAWQRQSPVWHHTVARFEAKLDDLSNTLRAHARDSEQDFRDRCAWLTRDSRVVCRLLPSVQGQTNLDVFYSRSFLPALQRMLKMPADAGPKDYVQRIMSDESGWVGVFLRAFKATVIGDEALQFVRHRLKEAVWAALGGTGSARHGHIAPLPPLGQLLAAQATGNVGGMPSDLLEQLTRAVVNLLPERFAPAGEGQLTTFISFPKTSGTEDRVKAFLCEKLRLPVNVPVHFMPNSPESLCLVMNRSSMAIDEVFELREAIDIWMQASRKEQQGDYLKWRQRLGYKDTLRVSELHDRQLIIQALLNALWEGNVDVEGSIRSPRRISIRVFKGNPRVKGDPEARRLDCHLTPVGSGSSWASVIDEYERLVLDPNLLVRDCCQRLIIYKLEGLDTGRCSQPAEAYRVFVSLMESEPAALERLARSRKGKVRHKIKRYQRFWDQELSGAMEMVFFEGAYWRNHQDLLRAFS